MLKSYLKKISKIANQGDAREESYYATLDELFKKIAQSFGKGKIHITQQPITTTTENLGADWGRRIGDVKDRISIHQYPSPSPLTSPSPLIRSVKHLII